MMIPQVEVEMLICDLFEEEALALGGLVALHDIEDDLVWRLVRSFDVIRSKALRRLDDWEPAEAKSETLTKPHPAIERFLFKLRTV